MEELDKNMSGNPMEGEARGSMSIEEFLKKDEQKDLLRFLTAGSVDDGKSTLIGRLLFDSKIIRRPAGRAGTRQQTSRKCRRAH